MVCDIRSVARCALEDVQIFKKNHVEFTDGPITLAAGALLVSGNCGPGSVISGQGSVVVEGSIQGNQRSPCRIDVVGDVIVLGSVAQAYIGG